MPAGEEKLTCNKCGKQLQRFICSWCRGKRTKRKFWFFKRPCEDCNGTGVVYDCPDWRVHLERSKAGLIKELAGGPLKIPKTQVCSKCRGMGFSYITSLRRPIICPQGKGKGVTTSGLPGSSGPQVGKTLCPTCGGTRGIIIHNGPGGGQRTIGCPRCHGKGYID